MSIPLTVNGSTFQFPQTGNKQWGAAVTAWASAVTTGMLQKAGGTFTLTNDVDFGANFGLKSIYYKSRNTPIDQTGIFQMSNTELITWRNGAGSGDNTLGVSPANVLLYNGSPVGGSITVDDTATINLDYTLSVLTANLVSLTANEDGYVLVWDNDGNTWVPAPQEGIGDLAGDVTGPSDNNVAESLTGLAGTVSVKAGNVTFINSVTPLIGQANTASGNGKTLLIKAQTTTDTDSLGGNLDLDSGAGTDADGYVRIKNAGTPVVYYPANSMIFDGYAVNPIITQQNSSSGGGGGGGDGDGFLTIENGILKMAGGPNVVLHCLEFIYGSDEYNYGVDELCQLVIELGFNSISPLVGDTYGALPYMVELGDAALAAGLIIGFNGDFTSDPDAWLNNPDFIEYVNNLPNAFVRIYNEVDIPPIYGDYPPLSAYVDAFLSHLNAYRAAGGTRVFQSGSYQGGRRLEYPRDAGATVAAGDPLGKALLGWQAYWSNDGTWYQGNADLPNGIAGTLEGVEQYNALNGTAATCMGILWVNTEGDNTDVVDIINLALTLDQSFMWWDLWRDTEGAPPHLNRLVTEIWDPPVTWTPTADIIAPLLLPSLTLYYEGYVPGEGGGGGGGGPTGLSIGNTMTLKAQDGYETGGTVIVRAGIGGTTNGDVQLYTGHDLAAAFTPDTVIMNIGGNPLFWATNDIIKHYYGQAFNTRLVVSSATLAPDDTIVGMQDLTGNITLTLPTTNLQLGLIYYFKDLDSSLGTYTATIDADGGTINGSSTLVMNTAGSSVMLALIDNNQWFTVGGGSGGGDGYTTVSEPDHIFLTSGNAVGFRKNVAKHFFYEDFDFIEDKIPDFNPIAFGTTNWLSGYRNAAGFISSVAALKNHPGIIRLTTDNTNDSGTFIQRGFESEGGSFHPYYVEDIYRMEGCFRLTSESNCGFFFGLSDSDILEVPYASNRVAFLFDTDVDTNIQCVCRSDGYQTLVDSGVAPEEGTWKLYTILQNVAGTFTFYINESLVATINTNVPSTEALALYVNMTTRTAAEKSIDVDYVALDTIDLGQRYDAPAGEIEFVSTDDGTTNVLGYTITAGSDRLLVVALYSDFGDGAAATCTFDGVAMDVATNSNAYVQIFYMFNPPVGTYLIEGSYEFGVHVVACQYNNVGSYQESSQGAAQSFNYTIGGSGLLVCAAYGTGTSAPLSDCTERYDTDGRAYTDSIRLAGGTFSVGGTGLTSVDGAGAVFLAV